MSYVVNESISYWRSRLFPGREAGDTLRECDAVALASLEHLGKKYRITRELLDGFIDCSTVVSQAHWIGGAVRVPFIAESQRLADNAIQVDSLADVVPADVFVAHSSVAAAPGGRHNHVALFLGWDVEGEGWAIEAREAVGVRIIRLEDVQHDGGIRRFCPNPTAVYQPGDWSSIVGSVPKLGRLGARLTARYGSTSRHVGTDVYAPSGCAVLSPISGWVETIEKQRGKPCLLSIRKFDDATVIVLKRIVLHDRIVEGSVVEAGQLIGSLDSTQIVGGCNRLPMRHGCSFLHLEMWAEHPPGSPLARDVLPEPGMRPPGVGSRLLACNSVYAIKDGQLRSPLAF